MKKVTTEEKLGLIKQIADWWNGKKMADREALLLIVTIIYQPNKGKTIVKEKQSLRERILNEMLLV